MDTSLTHWINALSGSSALVDLLMIDITRFGVPLMVLAVAVQWWARERRFDVRYAAMSAGLSFLLGLGINQFILLFVHRVRPYDAGLTHLIIARSADWSFPSDHATASFAIAAAFAARGLPRRAGVLLALALLVCFSRVYVGTHYVTDILGGAFTGIVAAVAVRLFYRQESRVNQFCVHML